MNYPLLYSREALGHVSSSFEKNVRLEIIWLQSLNNYFIADNQSCRGAGLGVQLDNTILFRFSTKL